MFGSETDLVTVLEKIEDSLERAAQGPAEVFREHYLRAWDLYGSHAVDGHESDEAERDLLSKHAGRISRLERILESAEGVVLGDEHVGHLFTFAGGLIQAMEVVPLTLQPPNPN